MRSCVAAVHALVSRLVPVDEVEAAHRSETLRWLAGTDDVYRRVSPATPPRHLVSYVVPVDPDDGAVLLVDHVKAGLWLPPGGHVDPGEHPADTARREVSEELGLVADTADFTGKPVFLTVTRTVGTILARHTDVTLWFTIACPRGRRLSPDTGEFRSVRWWSRVDLAAADPARFEPHLGRFLDKLARSGRTPQETCGW